MAGDAAAEFEVATRFAEGRGVPPSNEQAARWLERAAKQGLAPAQFRLGGLYEKGIGVKKDLAAARDLYLAAADKGNGKAMHNLAVLYAEGINGPADYHSAAQWFRKAADRGITDSQYNLAILYARGIGVEQNYAESYKWFLLAANQGDNEAAKKRDEVASHLDQQSLAAAQARGAEMVRRAAAGRRDQRQDAAGRLGCAQRRAAAKPKPRPAGAKTGRRTPNSTDLIRQAARRGDGIEPPLAQHMRGERQRAEQRHDGAVAHIEAAGIGAECRHDETPAVAGEAAPAHRAAALRDARQRMQMAGDLAVARFAPKARGGRSADRAPALGETAADISAGSGS